jgi:hypothetical protein
VLESLPSIEGQLVSFETAWSAFARAENLRNLWLLSRRRENQIACMRLAAMAAGSSTSNHLLAAALKDAERRCGSRTAIAVYGPSAAQD